MLEARSVAVVGASERAGTVGDQTIRQLLSGGFDGEVVAVNPRYDSIHGLETIGSLDGIGFAPDLVVLAVGNGQLEAEMAKAVAIGARSAAIFASCHGVAENGGSLRDRIRDLADEGGIPICGGNGMGFVNVADRLRVCGFFQPKSLEPGGVAFLSHSGSLFSALLHNGRGIRFNLVVSTGLEINTSMDRYLDWVLDRETTTVVALFLETIRDPVAFRSSLGRAAERDIPIVALKVGASPRARAAVSTHSEGLAGDDAVYEALFDGYGVHRVRSMDEMADTVELFAAGRPATAFGLGAIHDSGGERALLIDTASRVGIPMPTLSEKTTRRVAAVLDPGLEPVNPIDAWGTGRDAERVFTECLLAVADDPAIGVAIFDVDLTPEESPDDAYSNAVRTVATATDKPVAVLANLSSTVDPIQANRLRADGIPVLEGTETGIRAIGHLLTRHRRRALPTPAPRLTGSGDPSSGLAGDFEALAVLDHYGIPTPRRLLIEDEGDLAGVAMDFPMVIKTAEGVAHKTEIGGVVLDVGDEEGLRSAYRAMSDRLGPRVMLMEQIPTGVEVGMGMITDPQFGPVLILSAGGMLIELMGDSIAVLPPVDPIRAGLAVDRLAIRPMLEGVRGGPPSNLPLLLEVIARFSELVEDASDKVLSIDVNPVIAGPQRVVAVDALFEGGV